MLVLTDNPERVQPMVPPDVRWQGYEAADLSVADQALWTALGKDRPLWKASLQTDDSLRYWSRLVLIDEAPRSQFDALGELCRAQRPLPGPVACLALTGRRFHGHRDRPWVAARGNIHLSVAISEPAPAKRLLPGLTMLPAVATVRAVVDATDGALQPGIKWVNDVLVDGCKIAGVLTSTQTRSSTVESIQLGIGLNVAAAPPVPPTPFVPDVSCVADCLGAPLPRSHTWVTALLSNLAQGYRELCTVGATRLLDRYRASSLVVGERVRVYDETFGERDPADRWPPPIAQGEVTAIERDLSLRIAGRDQPIAKGRLAFESVCQRFEM